MVVKPTLAHGLQMCVGNLWKEDDFSDFTVLVEDTSFRCHRFILSACSNFFQGLFRSQMKECIEANAKLDGTTKGTFDIIINSIYKGVDGLSEDNVLDVWSATELLQIDYLTEECKKFLMENISVDNCFRFLNHATMYSAQNVIDHSVDFISKHFKQVRNVESLLQLPFDYFYKVIESDFLVIDSEDTVLDTILKWVNYTPSSEYCSSLFAGNGTLDEKSRSEVFPAADISTECLSLGGCLEKGNDEEKQNGDLERKHEDRGNENNNRPAALFDIRNDEDMNFSECVENTMTAKSNTVMLADGRTVCRKNDNDQVDPNVGDRKQHCLKLISACRLFIITPTCFENLMKQYRDLLVNTGAYNLVLEALMYTVCVDRRHDSWPEAAVHRASSSNKHVMVFVSDDKFMAYSLNTGSVRKFAKIPEECSHVSDVGQIIVFDNVLYLRYENAVATCSMFTKQKKWVSVNTLQRYDWKMLLAHGSYIYDLYAENNTSLLCRFSCIYGHNRVWSQFRTLDTIGNCLIRFHQYIVVFGTEDNVVTAHYCTTETLQIHKCPTLMDGTSHEMISFRHREAVYILQRNGSLWKVFSTDTAPVDFELVSKLWDFDCNLKGCVLYKKKLFIFCDDQVNPSTLLISLPGICENIQMIKINSRTQCLPMVLPESWLTS